MKKIYGRAIIFFSLFLFGCSPNGPSSRSTTSSSTTPSPSSTSTTQANAVQWKQIISSDGEALCALTNQGELYCWGTNRQSKGIATTREETLNALGTGDTSDYLSTPKKVLHPRPWKSVAMGQHSFICGIDDQDFLFCWGANYIFSFGYGGPIFYDNSAAKKIVVQTPYKVSPEQFSALTIENLTVCAVKKDDSSLWCFGEDVDAHKTASAVPQKINNGPFVTPLLIGRNLLAIDANRHLWEPRIGLGTTEWQKIVGGVNPLLTTYLCGIDNAQQLWCKGDNHDEILGVNAPAQQLANFTILKGGDKFIDIATINERFCAIKDDGSLWCWGKNTYDYYDHNLGTQKSIAGILGTGSSNPIITAPEQVKGVEKAKKVVATADGSFCALTHTKELYCFGLNAVTWQSGKVNFGILGAKNLVDTVVSQPAKVGTQKWNDVFIIGTMNKFVGCALDDKHALWCWGGNELSPIAPSQPVGKILSEPVLVTP